MGIGDAIASIGGREVKQFFGALEVALEASWLDQVALKTDSDQASETYKWLQASPQLREWIGGRLARGLSASGITIENKTFEATLSFLSDDIRRDKISQIMTRIDGLARRVPSHWMGLLSTLISNGTGLTSGLCYDGQYFFDDDHEEGDSGVQKNLLTNTEVGALAVTSATAPTPFEAANAVLGVIAYMLGIKDDKGEFMNETAREFLVMTSLALGPAFSSAVSSRTLEGSVDNPLVQQQTYKVGIAINPRLAYTNHFVVFRTDGAGKPLIRQEEVELEVNALGAGSEYEFVNNKQMFGIKLVGNVGYGLWQHAAHATLS